MVSKVEAVAVGWRVLNHGSPGKWSSRHLTRGGKRTLCCKAVPAEGTVAVLLRGRDKQLDALAECSRCAASLIRPGRS